MLRSMLLAGLLTGVAIPALAAADTSAVRSAENGGAALLSCHDGAWLPGTLQIDKRARPAGARETGQGLKRSPPPADCAFV